MGMAQMMRWQETADRIWAILDRNAARFEEIGKKQEETARQMKETDRRMEETDRRMKEADRLLEETDRLIKENARRQAETDRQLGKLSNRFGEVIECMLAPNLAAKFRELGFEFEKTHRNTEIVSREHDIILEVDAFLENGDKVMIAEAKTKPSIADVNDHIERMEKLRRFADLRSDKRSYLGAIGGMVFAENVKKYALKNGFYVIEPSGDTITITAPQGEYRPREW